MNIDFLLPRVSKRYLLLVSALVWTFAGGMLLFRGFTYYAGVTENCTIKLLICIFSGVLFYALLFTRISRKHLLRIHNMKTEKSVVFSFFNSKSYLMMFSMITLGIALRLSGLVSPEFLASMYITMGIPLLMSSFRFYYSFITGSLPSRSESVPKWL